MPVRGPAASPAGVFPFRARLAFSRPRGSSSLTVIHAVIRDQAGFHLRDGDARLPDRVRIIAPPPYTPELKPCEQAWDMIRDETGNRVFKTIKELRKAALPALRRFWNDAGAVLRLIGRPWLALQINALPPTQASH